MEKDVRVFDNYSVILPAEKRIIIMRRFIIAMMAAVVIAGVCGCSRDGEDDGESVAIARIDRLMAEYSGLDSAGRAAALNGHGAEIQALMQVLGADSTDDATVKAWSSSLPVEVFSPLADSIFPGLEREEKALGTILKRASEKGITLPRRRYAAVVWGRAESMVFCDSVMLIALNHYLGSDNDAYEHWPEYMRALKRPDMIPYDMAEALVGTAYPYVPGKQGRDVLSRMLYEGAMAEAKMRLVPDAREENVFGYDAETMADVRENEGFTWNKLVADRLLYSTDEGLLDRLFTPLPASTPISNAAPGRVLRYTGYRIVRSYLDRHPEAELDSLLSPGFYNSTTVLAESGYAPKVR